MKRILALMMVVIAALSAITAANIVFDGITTEGKEVYKFYPCDDYAISAYLVKPERIEMRHIVMVPYKDGRTDPSYGLKDSRVKLICYENSDYYGRNSVLLFPVIPEFRNDFRHLEMDRETLLSDDGFSHIDRQVSCLIDDALDFLRDEQHIDISDRVDIVGYSGEANFALRFSLLHPDKVWAVCAGGSSWSPSMGNDRLMGRKLRYPLGTGDIERYSDDFDPDEWKDIRFLVDMGMKDDRGSYNSNLFAEVDWAWGKEYREIWDNFCRAFVDLTDNAEMVSFRDLGHEPSDGFYNEFLRLNDDETAGFRIVEPYDAAHILTSRKSYDVPERYNFLYYAPTESGCPFCGSDVFRNDGEYGYVCENGHRMDVHMDSFVAGVYVSEKPFLNLGRLTLLYPPDHYDGRHKVLVMEDGSRPRMYSHGLGDGCLWIGFENMDISIRTISSEWIGCDILCDGRTYEDVRFIRQHP